MCRRQSDRTSLIGSPIGITAAHGGWFDGMSGLLGADDSRFRQTVAHMQWDGHVVQEEHIEISCCTACAMVRMAIVFHKWFHKTATRLPNLEHEMNTYRSKVTRQQ